MYKIPALVSLELRFYDMFRLVSPASAEKFRQATVQYCVSVTLHCTVA